MNTFFAFVGGSDASRLKVRGGVFQSLALAIAMVWLLPAHAGGLQCLVDFMPPVINVTTPIRAASIESASDIVAVEGLASDALNPVTSIIVNGQELLGSPGGAVEPFATTITAPWGLSVLRISATDECGNTSQVAQSFVRADAFYNAAISVDPGARVAAGLPQHYNQPAVDDEIRATVDDVATITERGLQVIDYAAILNDNVPTLLAQDISAASRNCSFPNNWTENYYRLTRGGWTVTDPRVTGLEPVTGAIRTEISTSEISVPLQAIVRQYTCTLGVLIVQPNLTVQGGAGALNVAAQADLGLSASNGLVDAGVSNVSVTSSLFVSLDCGLLQFLCDFLTQNFVDPLLSDVANNLGNQFLAGIDAGAEDVFNAYLPPASIELPPPFNATFVVAAGADTVTVEGPLGTGAVDIEIGGQVFPTQRGATIPADAPGAARHDGAMLSFTNQGYDLGFGVKDDVVNQVLWSAWYSGVLSSFDPASLVAGGNLPIESLTLEPLLPPIVMPDGPLNRIRVGLGDVALVVTIDLATILGPPFTGLIDFEAFASATYAGVLGIDETRQTLDFEVDATDVAIQKIASNAPPGTEGTLAAAVEQAFGVVGAALVEALVGQIPIPVLDLNELAPGIYSPGEIVALVGAVVDRPVDVATRITGFTAAENDTDGDGAIDSGDNCILVPNNDQRDTNADGFGNLCDADLNGDCVVNALDLGLFKSVFFSSNPDADFNGDGNVNVIDLGIFKTGFFMPPGPNASGVCP